MNLIYIILNRWEKILYGMSRIFPSKNIIVICLVPCRATIGDELPCIMNFGILYWYYYNLLNGT